MAHPQRHRGPRRRSTGDRLSDPTPGAQESRRRRFAQIASFLFWFFAVCFGLAALQVAVALRSNRVWTTYRGEPVSIASMRHELAFLLVAALLCALSAWHWHRALQSRTPSAD